MREGRNEKVHDRKKDDGNESKRKEQIGAKRWMRIWEEKVKKKHLRSLALKLFHLMVLKGIDGQKEEAQKGRKEKKRLNNHHHIIYFHPFSVFCIWDLIIHLFFSIIILSSLLILSTLHPTTGHFILHFTVTWLRKNSIKCINDRNGLRPL